MKKLAEKELKALAKSVFESHPEANVLYATEDGNLFLDNSKSMAYEHNRTVVKGNVLVIQREQPQSEQSIDENPEAEKLPKPNAKELAKMMLEAETIEALDALLPEGETRTTVLGAYQTRKEFFNQPEN